jgi:N-acetylglucosaminyldiphosphoundecaprenol N-acetyl-beta-D-mannosaminyltransferase
MIERMVASGRPHYLVTPNVDFLVQASQDVELRRILMEAHLVLCDGTPLLWASRLLGNPLPERVAGSDLVPLLMRLAAEKGYRIFFLGGSQETAELAVAKLRQKYPKLAIAGQYSPPFRDLLEMDHAEIRRRIQEARPDLLLVCFGCPKQEKWMAMHYRSLGVPVSMGVGGTIDFLAGRLARAPIWMQRTGTEWLFRMAQEPRRLLRRYAKDFWYFGRLITAQWWRMRRRSGPRNRDASAQTVQNPAGIQEIQLPEWVDAEAARQSASLWKNFLAVENDRLLDLSKVRFIDSTGIGLLVRLRKQTALQGRRLVLIAPGDDVRRALDLMRLTPFFLLAQTRDEALALIERAAAEPASLISQPGSSSGVLLWQGEITAANADAVWATTEHFINTAPERAEQKIDMAGVGFIDSTGIGLMVRARKRAATRGGALRFTGVQPHVLNVVRISRLEGFLLG